MSKQLYRSKDNKVVGGVCGGVAEYFNLDPTLVRLFWVLLTISAGIGVIVYIICMIIIPEEGSFPSESMYQAKKPISLSKDKQTNETYHVSNKNKNLAGFILIFLGTYLLAKRYMPWFHLDSVWPLLFIAVGIYILYRGKGVK